MRDTPRRFRFSVWWAIAMTLALLVGAGLLWYHADGDLRQVAARARAMGVQPTWAEVGLVESPADVLADWKRLNQLAESVRSYQDTVEGWTQTKPGRPLPPELRTHHDRLPATEVAELIALSRRLAASGVVPRTQMGFMTELPDISRSRSLAKLQAERIVLANDERLLDEIELGLAQLTIDRPHCLIQNLVLHSALAIWRNAVCYRLRPAPRDPDRLIAILERAITVAEAASQPSWHGEFRGAYDLVAEIGRGNPAFAAAGMSLVPDWLRTLGAERIIVRMGRGRLLDLELDAIAIGQRPVPGHVRATDMRAFGAQIESLPRWNPANRLALMTLPATGMVMSNELKSVAALRVLVAELRGTPWPSDPTDPAGAPVRRIERDGRLIGFYLLKDGSDEGGKPGKDECVALYEPLGSPLASDPPKP